MAVSQNPFSHPANMLVLEIFRLNGALIALGDDLMAPLALTSARWQVIGAIAEARGALSVAGIARNMGLVRQSVQRIVNELQHLGWVGLAPNPHHRRAKLVHLTEQGVALFDTACARWNPVADALLAGTDAEENAVVAACLQMLRSRVEAVQLQN
jgi:DNA-binding MarR family transcriptional regulator